ncbi:MAG: chemotaxis protein CheW [Candidatus Omnitrophica bacterium]|nr:chemotaxis protein CheW [Candidatus Omnitrophota bacterium]
MELVIFRLADKEYGADIRQIRQVIRMREVTPVPDSAAFVEGVISLHGKVIPLVSLRKKMGVSAEKPSRWSRIIVTTLDSNLIGVVVDTVSDVISVETASITPPDDVLKNASYLEGVAKLFNRLILIVNIEKLLTKDDRIGIDEVHKKVEIRKRS